MNVRRTVKHLLATKSQIERAFPHSSLNVIEAAIKEGKAVHAEEVRFAVESGLDGIPLLRG